MTGFNDIFEITKRKLIGLVIASLGIWIFMQPIEKYLKILLSKLNDLGWLIIGGIILLIGAYLNLKKEEKKDENL